MNNFKLFFKQLFCSHINKTEIIEKGDQVYTKIPKYEYDEYRDYTLDVVKETCYKCGKEQIKQKRNYKDKTIYTL